MTTARRGIPGALPAAIIGLFGMAPHPLHADPAATVALPVIEIRPSSDGVEITGRVVGYGAGDVKAEMKIDRAGESGNVSTTQGASWSIVKGDLRDIAKVGVTFAVGDRLTVSVTLRQDERVIAQTRLEVPGQ